MVIQPVKRRELVLVWLRRGETKTKNNNKNDVKDTFCLCNIRLFTGQDLSPRTHKNTTGFAEIWGQCTVWVNSDSTHRVHYFNPALTECIEFHSLWVFITHTMKKGQKLMWSLNLHVSFIIALRYFGARKKGICFNLTWLNATFSDASV